MITISDIRVKCTFKVTIKIIAVVVVVVFTKLLSDYYIRVQCTLMVTIKIILIAVVVVVVFKKPTQLCKILPRRLRMAIQLNKTHNTIILPTIFITYLIILFQVNKVFNFYHIIILHRLNNDRMHQQATDTSPFDFARTAVSHII